MIRLLCAHEITKHVCKISHLNSKRLLRKLQKNVRGLLYFAAPCRLVCRWSCPGVGRKMHPWHRHWRPRWEHIVVYTGGEWKRVVMTRSLTGFQSISAFVACLFSILHVHAVLHDMKLYSPTIVMHSPFGRCPSISFHWQMSQSIN